MIIEIILALVLGIIAGTFTGLMPGIHINLVASLLLSSIGYFAGVPPITLVVFIVSMSITHTFLDFIPSIYIGAPEEDNFLSIMPGHEMTLNGRGHEAVVLTLYGSILSLVIILIFTPIFIWFLPSFYQNIKFLLPFLLIFISVYILLRENKIITGLVIFLLSGLLGVITFNLPVKEPLMPLLTGLFGLSNIVFSLKQKSNLKKQTIPNLKEINVPKKELLRSLFASFISAPFCSFLPGIGSGHAATIGSEIITQERRGFLILLGSINTIIMALSFITLYSIGKTRSGSAAAIKTILQDINLNHVFIILIVIIITCVFSFIIGLYLSKLFASYLNKVNYYKLNIVVILILITVNFIFSNWIGMIVLITSTVIGLYCINSQTRRIHLMACLILPSIIYYLTN